LAASTNVRALKAVAATATTTEFGPRVGKIELYLSATAFNTTKFNHISLARESNYSLSFAVLVHIEGQTGLEMKAHDFTHLNLEIDFILIAFYPCCRFGRTGKIIQSIKIMGIIFCRFKVGKTNRKPVAVARVFSRITI
jgi:hypothetical protein